MQAINEIKAKFREGKHAEALEQCEDLCLRNPNDTGLKRLCALMHGLVRNYRRSSALLKEIFELNRDDGDALFNIGVCEREQGNFKEAAEYYSTYASRFPKKWEGWSNLAECQFQLGKFAESLGSAATALKLNASAVPPWITQGDCLRALKRYDEALKSYRQANAIEAGASAWANQGLTLLELHRHTEAVDCFSKAIKLDSNNPGAHAGRGDALDRLGRVEEAAADYLVALQGKPDDEAVLKKACSCLVRLNRTDEALQICRNALKVQPSMLAAKLGIAWVVSQMVPSWHIPMMNELARNDAYHAGLKAAVTPEKLVFEIGAGSGLLSMMAARLGARTVVACEAVPLISETARRIVVRNKCEDAVKVLAKSSFDIEIGEDLPEKADLLVHEIFSSELIAEYVLPAIEDAKQRLINPDAQVLPAAGSIMIALVGGEDVGKYLHVSESYGFDLREFNAISPKKVPFYREDLHPRLLSGDIEAFRFDFANESYFPSQDKILEITATEDGLCFGVIQWIRLEIDAQTRFQNHPSEKKSVSNWQHVVFRFDEPICLQRGSAVRISAAHDRSAPWFDLAAD